jgi:hypothetical protein
MSPSDEKKDTCITSNACKQVHSTAMDTGFSTSLKASLSKTRKILLLDTNRGLVMVSRSKDWLLLEYPGAALPKN